MISKSKVTLELPGFSVSGDAVHGYWSKKPRSSGLIAIREARLERYNSDPENRPVVSV
ncbi:MAG: hypothetical protein OSB47_14305 [Pirellulaceae bacterium]|nr:hypothetical protein [Pirellulaceae bacterium]